MAESRLPGSCKQPLTLDSRISHVRSWCKTLPVKHDWPNRVKLRKSDRSFKYFTLFWGRNSIWKMSSCFWLLKTNAYKFLKASFHSLIISIGSRLPSMWSVPPDHWPITIGIKIGFIYRLLPFDFRQSAHHYFSLLLRHYHCDMHHNAIWRNCVKQPKNIRYHLMSLLLTKYTGFMQCEMNAVFTSRIKENVDEKSWRPIMKQCEVQYLYITFSHGSLVAIQQFRLRRR